MYYEAKTVNTQLLYSCKQLEKVRETLETAWTAHKHLHQAAGLDVSEADSGLLQTHDVSSSSVCPPAELSFGRSESLSRSPQTDGAGLVSVPTCLGEPIFTTRRVDFCVYGDDFRCRTWRNPQSTAVQGPLSSRRRDFGSNASQRPNYIEFADHAKDEWTARQSSDRQLTAPPQSPSALYFVNDMSERSAVLEPTSAVFDADERFVDWSTRHANDDLESLFGSDDWWASDESWSWQCGSPLSDVDEATWTVTETGPAKSNGCSPLVSPSRLNDAACGNFRHHENIIPLHVEALVDDSCC